MKKIVTFLTIAVLLITAMGNTLFASAADVANATIDATRTGSITLYKYDITSAERDNAWDKGSYVSTGVADPNGVAALAPYALQGVEFTYVKVADLITEQEDGVIEPKYVGLDADILAVLSLSAASSYKVDSVHSALSTALATDTNATKNALEAYAAAHGTAMAETDATGKSSVADLPLGLYLLVETKVPENVVATTAPFFISLPMTTVDGAAWNYDVCVYPKNETGMPTLEKTVREAADSTGKTEDYAHTATASVGDVLEYRISSKLPAISSAATYLSTYNFVDTLSAGLSYNKDVELSVYSGDTLLDVDTSAMYTVTYDGNEMTIAFTPAGLSAINAYFGNCTLVITYSATLNNAAVLGDNGNDNEVTLTWKRTNTTYFDTLSDCCHVYSYGIEVTKQFNGKGGNFANVEFVLENTTDGYFVTAKNVENVWYVTGFVTEQENATKLVPNDNGVILLKGVEDDSYELTEVKTDSGYTLLPGSVSVVITASESENVCEVCTANLLTATAKVNGEENVMVKDGESASATATLKVVNTWIDIPVTGDSGTFLLCFFGVIGAAVAVLLLVSIRKKSKN